jgi:polysaccharide biosynthesis transport protein
MNDRNGLLKPFSDVNETGYVADLNSLAAFPYPGSEAEAGSKLKDYWRSIRRYLWLVIILPLIATAVVLFYLAGLPDIYEAYGQVQVDLESNPALGAAKSGAVLMNSSVSDPAYFNTQLRILNSSQLIGRVVTSLNLDRDPTFSRGNPSFSRWQNIKRTFGLAATDKKEKKDTPGAAPPPSLSVAPATSSSDLDEAERLSPFVDAIKRSIRIEPVKETRLPSKETRLIELRYTHPDPQRAASIVNTVLDTFVRNNLEKKTETNEMAGEFIHKRIAELQSQIRDGEQQLNSYANSHQILSLNGSENTVVERLTGLNRQLLEAENERKIAEAALAARGEPGVVEALSDATNNAAAAAESKLADLRQARAELLVETTDEAPPVVAIDKQIAVLEQRITDVRQRAVKSTLITLQARYREAEKREQALRSAFEQQRKETLTQNEAAINYRILQQEVETQKGFLNSLLQREKENDVMMAALAGTPNNIHVVDYALIPKRPIAPRRWLGVAIAFVVSLLVSLALAILLGQLDDSVKSTDEIEGNLHLPALAVVPAIGGTNRRRLLAGLTLPSGKVRSATPLVTDDPHSPLAEAYRRLRTSVLLSTAGQPPQTLLVTSSLPDEGKTTTAVNIALTLAQAGDKVLVIDADMHRPSLRSVFGIDDGLGLSSALVTEPSEQELSDMIHPYKDTNLFVLLAGAIPPNPAELLGSKQMHSLIEKLESQFKYIIIDSPPITYFTDSVLLTAVVDGVLLVINSGKTSREIVRRSRKVLKDVNARVFGAVLNNADLKPLEYSY